MPPIQGMCKICRCYVRRAGSRLLPHVNRKTGKPCRGRNPRPEGGGYTIGFDHDPWVMNGGLPTLGRNR